MAWVLTRSQTHHRSSLNKRFPRRSTKSDGAIGDYAHSQGTSGHNPDDTVHDNAEWDGDADTKQEVRAIDVDKDLDDERGATMEDVVQHYVKIGRAGKYLPFRYIIYKGRIWRKSNGWVTETYTGSNSHTEHAHFSGDYSDYADEVIFDFRLDELGDPMELTPANLKAISEAVVSELMAERVVVVAATDTKPAEDWSVRACIAYGPNIGRQLRTLSNEIKAGVAAGKVVDDAILKNVLADDGDLAKVISEVNRSADKVLAHAGAFAEEEKQLIVQTGNALSSQVQNVDEELMAKLNDPQTPDEQVAVTLVNLLGDRRHAIVSLMQQYGN